MKIEGLPVIDIDESEQITVAVRADDLLEGDTTDPKRHPLAIALRRQDDVDDARVTRTTRWSAAASSGSVTTRGTSGCSSSCRRPDSKS